MDSSDRLFMFAMLSLILCVVQDGFFSLAWGILCAVFSTLALINMRSRR